MNYAYFSSEGRLLYIASRPSVMVDPEVVEREVSRDTDPNSIYLDPVSQEVMDKQPFEVAVAINSLTGIPSDTTATLPGAQVQVHDGELDFEADVFEVISVHLDHPRYIARLFEVQTGPEEA